MIRKMLAVLLCAAFAAALAGCGGSEMSEANVIVVMDASDSMAKTDSDGLAKNIANILLYALDGQSFSGFPKTKFGVVTYGKEAERTVDLTDMKNIDELSYEKIKNSIKNISYEDKSGTNYYSGFSEALAMCAANPAKRNFIYVMSDGQLDVCGTAGTVSDTERQSKNEAAAAEGKKKIEEAFPKASEQKSEEDVKYIVHTFGIDTSGENVDFTQLKELASAASGIHHSITEKLDLSEEFGKLIGEFPWMQDYDVKQISGSECAFTVDKRYKNVQVILAETGNGKLEIESIKSPRDEKTELKSAETEYKTKDGTIVLDVRTDTSAAVNIKKPHKGEWTITANDNAAIVGLFFGFNPFPWYIIPAAAALIVFLIWLIMWCLKIPPVRYRKKPLPGALTVRLTTPEGQLEILSGEPFMNLLRKGRYLNKGNLTLSSVIGKKGFTDRVFRYKPAAEYEPDMITLDGGTSGMAMLYSGQSTSYSTDAENMYELMWEF